MLFIFFLMACDPLDARDPKKAELLRVNNSFNKILANIDLDIDYQSLSNKFISNLDFEVFIRFLKESSLKEPFTFRLSKEKVKKSEKFVLHLDSDSYRASYYEGIFWGDVDLSYYKGKFISKMYNMMLDKKRYLDEIDTLDEQQKRETLALLDNFLLFKKYELRKEEDYILNTYFVIKSKSTGESVSFIVGSFKC